MYINRILGASAIAFMAGSHAHMIMNTPTPYGYKTLQTAPLDNRGYDFPCQSGSRADAFEAEGAYNPMTVGQNNLLNFTGSAVHGGGSCQLSVTYDNPPPADKSKWKVIHSYVGSCPAQAAGNLEPVGTDGYGRPYASKLCTSDDQTECLKHYEFKLPTGLKNGNATLAWTWFNKIGNREMYMNCAPITISGGADDDTVFNSLPEMFVANIPGQCTTKEGVISFPNPGKQVTYGEAVSPDANYECPSASSTGSASAYPDYAGVSSTSAAASSYATAVQSSTMATAYASSAATSGTALASAYPTAAAGSSSSTSYSSNSSSSGNSTCTSGSVACPTPGSIICIGSTQFGICNINYCAVPEALAAGTNCTAGVIAKRDVDAAAAAPLFNRRHMHSHGRFQRRSLSGGSGHRHNL